MTFAITGVTGDVGAWGTLADGWRLETPSGVGEPGVEVVDVCVVLAVVVLVLVLVPGAGVLAFVLVVEGGGVGELVGVIGVEETIETDGTGEFAVLELVVVDGDVVAPGITGGEVEVTTSLGGVLVEIVLVEVLGDKGLVQSPTVAQATDPEVVMQSVVSG